MSNRPIKPYYRRRLPHYQPVDSILFSTFRIVDLLPKAVLSELVREHQSHLQEIESERDQQRRLKMIHDAQQRYFGNFDKYLDRVSTDIRWLQNPAVATTAYNTIFHYNGRDYDVVAFCVMPNHVHLVTDMREKNKPLHVILQQIKSYTAVQSNIILNRRGPFWHHENYDHVIRNGEELKKIVRYVIKNPVSAGLVKQWNEWKWTYLNEKYLE
jgi:REP element-mobilizing transposase RayT